MFEGAKVVFRRNKLLWAVGAGYSLEGLENKGLIKKLLFPKSFSLSLSLSGYTHIHIQTNIQTYIVRQSIALVMLQ